MKEGMVSQVMQVAEQKSKKAKKWKGGRPGLSNFHGRTLDSILLEREAREGASFSTQHNWEFTDWNKHF
jgi:hypothetical protein